MFLTGTFLIANVSYLIMNLPLLFVDVTTTPSWLYKFKIEIDQNVPVCLYYHFLYHDIYFIFICPVFINICLDDLLVSTCHIYMFCIINICLDDLLVSICHIYMFCIINICLDDLLVSIFPIYMFSYLYLVSI